MQIQNNLIRQEIIKIFHDFCKNIETINPNDYEEVSSVNDVNPEGKKIRTVYLKKKNV